LGHPICNWVRYGCGEGPDVSQHSRVSCRRSTEEISTRTSRLRDSRTILSVVYWCR